MRFNRWTLKFYQSIYHNSIGDQKTMLGGGRFYRWTNVRRGCLFYLRHYQRRVSLNKDYYDLFDLKVLR